MAKAREYLDPNVLNKLGSMELVARCAMEGLYSGLHPSPFHGFSVEYSDHRNYQPGDELKCLDWKMYGRSDKLYVKQFLQETNLTVYLLLDSSASMGFASGSLPSKLRYGSFLSAALAYLMLRQGDSVSLITFADRITGQIPAGARRTHLNKVLTGLQHNTPAGRTDLAAVLHSVAEMTHRRGLVILISDLLDDVGEVQRGLAHLRHLNHDVILFHTLDPMERRLDYDGLVEFRDMEGGGTVRTFPQSVREAYCLRVEAFIDEVMRSCGRGKIDYHLLDTAQPLDKALLSYLARRKVMM